MNDDAYSIGQASAAVAMANDAIDNARRAAASSRSRRAAGGAEASLPPDPCNSEGSKPFAAPQTHRTNPTPDAADLSKVSPSASSYSLVNSGSDRFASNMDLKNNDNAYHVIATLITERLLPKIDGCIPGATHYTLTEDDAAFFRKMLPYSVRRSFVDALRYRLQLLKGGELASDSAVGKLTTQCQMLGLDRDNSNVMLDLSQSAGASYPINYKNQGQAPAPPGQDHSTNNEQSNTAGMQQSSYSISISKDGDNGVAFGLNSPMAFSPNNTFSPSNNARNNYGLSPGQATALAGSNADWETSAESMARQQIMAEINETKFLMRGSVTPDAVNFWKKHLEELSQRLVALSLEEQLKAAGSGGSSVGGGIGSTAPNEANYDVDVYNKAKVHYKAPSVENHEEYLEGNCRTPDEDMGSGGVAGDRSYHQGNHALDPNTEAVPASPIQSPRKQQFDELPVCDVVAPSDLPGGYMFEAQLGSKKFLATVPPGGVTKGQRFVSTMRKLETIEIPVPLGAWRDSATECFNDGVLHPLFLNTLLFPCIALGQIMTRTGLDWQGEPANKLVSSLSCANMTVFLMFWLSMNASAGFMLRVAWERGRVLGGEYYIVIILFNLVVLIYMINLTRKVRETIRHKYQIPEDKCIGLEDCMSATFCMPCVICQMGRHTADFDTYRATCCTKTGLPRQVELAPVTFYEDQYQNMNDDPHALA